MAVCAHAQTAIFFFDAKIFGNPEKRCSRFVSEYPRQRTAPTNPRRQIHMARFIVVAFPVATFADFCAIFLVSRPLPGLHDARL
jgi:hypothetical protein